jgi:hypothetical protein
MLKISRIILCEYNKSCNTLHNVYNKIEFAVFWIFYDFLRNFAIFSNLQILLEIHFCAEALGKNWGQAIGSLAIGAARIRPMPANRRRSPPGEGLGSTTCSPRVGSWLWLGRRSRRRGRSVIAGGGGRGGSGSGESRGGEAQCAAIGAWGWSKEGLGEFGWRRERAELWAQRGATMLK